MESLIIMRTTKSKYSFVSIPFYNTQGSVYLTDKDDMANLFAAIYALRKITWFKSSVRDIRAFKVENWSDFTQIVKEED